MQPDLMSTKAAADKIGMHYLKVLNRGELLCLHPKIINRTFYWTDSQIEQIAIYKPTKKTRKNTTSRYAKEKIQIIELFLSLKNNSSIEISNQTKQTLSFVNETINEYLATKYLIIESKINL